MSDYTTYDFYANKYYGDTVPETDFPKWLSRATDKLNYVTFGHINDDALEDYNVQIQKATCALIDLLYSIDQIAKQVISADERNIKSKSSGNESVTFETTKTSITEAAASDKAQYQLITDTVSEYLAGTGLLYAGY